MNTPPVSASTAEPTTLHRVLCYVRIGPLGLTSEGLLGLVGIDGNYRAITLFSLW